MAMGDQLAGHSPGGNEAKAVNDIVQTGFQNLEQHLAGFAADFGRFGEVFLELALVDAIEPLKFLFFPETDAVIGKPFSAFGAVLAGRNCRPAEFGTLAKKIKALSAG